MESYIMKFKFRKTIVALFTVAVMLCILPIMAFTAEGDVCQIIGEGDEVIGSYDDFADALAEVGDGQTIKLLADIDYTSGIVIAGKTITFDVNGNVLSVVNKSGHGLEVGAGGEVLLINDVTGGAFNVKGSNNKYGVHAHDGGKAQVTTANGNGFSGYGVNADGSGSEVTVYGNIPFSAAYGIRASAGAAVTVYGNVSGGGGMTVSGTGTTVTVYGYSNGGGTGVIAEDGAIVNILGNVYGGGAGVVANTGAQVTVDGYIWEYGGTHEYIEFNYKVVITREDHEPISSKIGYFEYNHGTSYVWVKYDANQIDLSITQPKDIEVTEGIINKSLTFVTEVKKPVEVTPTYQWYRNPENSNKGGTLIDGATGSTYDLPESLTAAGSPYFYYCVVTGENVFSGASDVAKVTVLPASETEAELFTVTVNGSYAGTGNTGAGEYTEGETVTIKAGGRNDFTFGRWTVINGGAELAAASNATTTFTMPAGNVTVTAGWIIVEQNNNTDGDQTEVPETSNTPDTATEPETTSEPEPPSETEPPSDPEPINPGIGDTTPDRPLPPVNRDNLVPEGAKYIEVDVNGTPLGEWHWDEHVEEWIFTEYTPLGNLPKTGGEPSNNLDSLMGFILIGLTFIGIAAVLIFAKPGKTKQ